MSSSILLTLYLFVALQQPTVQNATPASFVGNWVGTQTWIGDNVPPSAKAPQQVALTIDLVDGKLVGNMPVFGGTDVLTFVDTKIVGDELEASAVVKKPQPAAGAEGGGRGKAWTDDVKFTLHLKADKVALTGTADVVLGDVKWMTFKYEMGKKRTRY
jgi:hypothetical protein